MVAHGVNAEKVGGLLESFDRSQGGHTVRVLRARCSDDERRGDRYNGPVGRFERDRLQFLREGQFVRANCSTKKQVYIELNVANRRKTSIVNKG